MHEAQIILTTLFLGVDTGSVIMKNVKRSNEPVVYLCNKTIGSHSK